MNHTCVIACLRIMRRPRKATENLRFAGMCNEDGSDDDEDDPIFVPPDVVAKEQAGWQQGRQCSEACGGAYGVRLRGRACWALIRLVCRAHRR